ncbi:pilus assembly protein [Pseudomonas sp. CR3202]|uniref:pilus assembly protein n=1 Tax=Pseudomonas sp. CR3202 TaxID=3351532 RepID=UPI003BF434C7
MNAQWLSGVMAVLFALPMAVLAEDIDLFVGSTPTRSADNPNVIILIDNTTNWSAQNQGWPSGETQGRYELDAIRNVVNSLAPADKDANVNLGLMFLTQGQGNRSQSGGYVRSAVKPMTVANRAELTRILNGINVNDNAETVPASVGYDQAMFEVFKYFGGYTSVAKSSLNQAGGTLDATHFGAIRYAGEPDAKTDVTAFSDRATMNNYIPVISGDSTTCSGKNYLIIIGNGWPTPAEKSGNTYIGETLLNNVGGNPSQIYATSTADVRYADEMARFLYQTDVSSALGKQNVITYAIDVFKNHQSTELTALLKSMSEGVGGGKYFEANSAVEIADSLGTILAEIQSVNSVFASVSLPVSVNTQGTYLNQVFIGMFRPDKDALPRWYGNLKQYKLAYVGGVLRLVDADDASAISASGSGFISECARSYWTPVKTATDSYWTNIDVQNCPPSDPASSNTRDGNVVEKGGQGYKLRAITPADRNVKTCGTTCVETLAQFDTDNGAITKEALGNASMTDADRLDLINWARGLNTKGETFAGKTAAELAVAMRRSSHGDVVHSRPVAINYAASDTAPPQVVVFYGANDGMLRAVNGNRDGGLDIAGKAPGGEIWSFVAPESYGMFLRNRDNLPKMSFPTSSTGSPKSYGFDGAVVAYKDASKAWIFATMRRGGRAVYAFNVSTPGTPKLLWKLGCTSADDRSCTSDSSGIGQTWATPVVLKASGYQSSGSAKPLLIMGGGYDACEDSDPATTTCKSSGKGHVIYLVDAESGQIKQSFPTDGGVVGDVTVAKDANGMARFAYAADLSGNVYRISGSTANSPIGTTSPGNWTITKIAALGGTGVDARKFIYGPDVVNDNGTYVLLLGSGDREKPISFYDDAAAVQNYFFMLKDRPTESTWLASETGNCAGASILCKASLYAITSTSTPPQDALDLKKGWYLALSPTEQVVTSALTIFGNVTFSTHRPKPTDAASCSPNLGDARVYNINFKNAEGKNGERYAELVGDGLPPSPVAGLVKLDGNGPTVPFCIGCSSSSSLEGGEPPTPPIAVQPKARVFWNIEK